MSNSMNNNEPGHSVKVQPLKKSLAQKHFLALQPCEIWCLLRKKTSSHSTLEDCLRPALEHPEILCGLYACDEECYDLFRCLFWPLIMDYHQVNLRTLRFTHDFGDSQQLLDLPVSIQDRIHSIRIRLHRSIQGYPMISKLTVEQLLELEDRIRRACDSLDSDLQGHYRSWNEINEVEQEKLWERDVLFKEPTDPHLITAGYHNHWPNGNGSFRDKIASSFWRGVEGRGIYLNQAENLVIWVNEEDHLSIIAQSDDHRMNATYDRLVRATKQINEQLPYQLHPRLGYLTYSPINIGTTLRVDVRVKLFHEDQLISWTQLGKNFDLKIETTNEKHIYTISNLIRLGRTEFHTVRGLWNGIIEILQRDQQP